MDISDFEVRECPSSAVYIPNFITSEEEKRILSQISRAPKPKWTQLLNRRLINYGGVPHPNGMIAEEIPKWLQVYMEKINNLNFFQSQKANHVLVNEYLPGQGIMPHTDGPLFHPIITTITCGSYTVLNFIERNVTRSNDKQCRLHKYNNDAESLQQESLTREINFKMLLEPRSLLILKDELYNNYLHGIDEVKQDVLCDKICNYENCERVHKMGSILKRGIRISLTIRHVPKTTTMKLKFC
ncbi:alpha-ketoglutarate-dependent dioxygenase alkB homolog 6 [Bactrocera neohumeralis]|uniref:alpha-ketoglutarate-dependent dioxygenase alkB homolog 6 n=1 Tax=Bactrocera tryoni TaxID=59916 RepID=UPI001A95B145|nr:alpha-ketoglutarate-dependent dioxygenase alkB homolog 6 [Bactrocera tryoni]XP_050319151.1 alpha-ketoglutarate-dependent dioxygenase alkB homolog 6 [Bactrocera neohumeralis]